MIRGFYSAASGLKSQQQKLNVVGNNISNISTVGFKSQNQQFVTLLYKNVNGALPPISTGHGTRPVDIATDLTNGSLQRTDRETDFTIIGEAFFAVEDGETGEILYTKNGNFQYQVSDEEEGKFLITPAGKYVLDAEGERINVTERKAEAAEDDEVVFDLRKIIGIYEFKNPYALEHVGGTYLKANEVSGEAEPFIAEEIEYDPEDGGVPPEIPEILQGYLESSNVDIAAEMVKMIEASKAFQFSSRVVTVTDELAQTMNQMR